MLSFHYAPFEQPEKNEADSFFGDQGLAPGKRTGQQNLKRI